MKRIHFGLASLACVLLFSVVISAQQNNDRPRPNNDDRLFENLFRVPRDVKLTDEQKTKLQTLRKEKGEELATKLGEIQTKLRGVYTQEQIDAQRKATAEARNAGKNAREAREAADAAIELSEKQKAEISKLRKEQQELQTTARRAVIAILGRTNDRAGRGQRIKPTHANVKYGPHERNVLDFWQAESDKPTPVLVSIHGGGFRGGNKSVSGDLLQRCLNEGISVAAITYRFSQHAIAPASFTDSARAIQFIRSKSKEWNLDTKRFAATGGSAGAGLSLWLGFHDDMADPDSDDLVARQSTRLSCMFVNNGQTSYDPRYIRELFEGTDTYKHSALAQLFGVDLGELDNLPKEKYELFEEVSAMPHLTKDDPPVILIYSRSIDAPIANQSVGIHHAKFGQALKEQMDKLGIECEVHHQGKLLGDGQPTSTLEFMKNHFGMSAKE